MSPRRRRRVVVMSSCLHPIVEMVGVVTTKRKNGENTRGLLGFGKDNISILALKILCLGANNNFSKTSFSSENASVAE